MGAAIACTLAEMQLFYQTLNFSNKFLGFMGAAAYTVYIIHPWFINVWILVFIEIMKAAHVSILWIDWQPLAKQGPIFLPMPEGGMQGRSKEALAKLQPFADGYIWGGWAAVFVLTQITVWPAAACLRRLPVLKKIL